MNARISWYTSSIACSSSLSLSVNEIGRYMREKSCYLLRRGLGGSRHCGGQPRSVDNDRLYVYEGANESMNAACPGTKLADIQAFSVKECVTIDRKKKKKYVLRSDLLGR